MDDHDPLAAIKARLDEHVARVGWAVQGVVDPTGAEPTFGHTIGLHETFKHAELLMIGFTPTLMLQLLNEAGSRVREGAVFDDGGSSDSVIQGFPVIFREIPYFIETLVRRPLPEGRGGERAVIRQRLDFTRLPGAQP